MAAVCTDISPSTDIANNAPVLQIFPASYHARPTFVCVLNTLPTYIVKNNHQAIKYVGYIHLVFTGTKSVTFRQENGS